MVFRSHDSNHYHPIRIIRSVRHLETRSTLWSFSLVSQSVGKSSSSDKSRPPTGCNQGQDPRIIGIKCRDLVPNAPQEREPREPLRGQAFSEPRIGSKPHGFVPVPKATRPISRALGDATCLADNNYLPICISVSMFFGDQRSRRSRRFSGRGAKNAENSIRVLWEAQEQILTDRRPSQKDVSRAAAP